MTASFLRPPPPLKNPVSPAALRGRDGKVLHDPSKWLVEQRTKGS